MKKQIIIAGSIIADVVKNIDIYPQVGMMACVSEISPAVGGCVPNTAIDIAKIDSSIPVAAMGRVGDDENGRYIIQKLKENNVNVDKIIISDSCPTSFCDVMSLPNGDRTFFHKKGSMEGDSHFEDPSKFYTDPLKAREFVEKTNSDALAIAIGTAYGTYTCKPKLDIERLKKIRSTIDTPLVLHSGSGLSKDDFQNCIENGITKVNIFTDLYIAGKKAMIECSGDYHDTRLEKVKAIKDVVKNKILLFGSDKRC